MYVNDAIERVLKIKRREALVRGGCLFLIASGVGALVTLTVSFLGGAPYPSIGVGVVGVALVLATLVVLRRILPLPTNLLVGSLVDEQCNLQGRVTTVISIDAGPARSLIEEQAARRLNADVLKPLCTIVVPRSELIGALLGLAAVVWAVYFLVPSFFPYQADIARIEEIAAQEALPEHVREELLTLKDALEEGDSDSIEEALARAEASLEEALAGGSDIAKQRELDTILSESDEQKSDEQSATKPSPTPQPSSAVSPQASPSPTPAEQTKKESGQKEGDQGGKQDSSGSKSKSQSDNQQGQEGEDQKGSGSGEGKKEGQGKTGDGGEGGDSGEGKQGSSQGKQGKGSQSGSQQNSQSERNERGGSEQNSSSGDKDQSSQQQQALSAAQQAVADIKKNQEQQRNDPSKSSDGKSSGEQQAPQGKQQQSSGKNSGADKQSKGDSQGKEQGDNQGSRGASAQDTKPEQEQQGKRPGETGKTSPQAGRETEKKSPGEQGDQGEKGASQKNASKSSLPQDKDAQARDFEDGDKGGGGGPGDLKATKEEVIPYSNEIVDRTKTGARGEIKQHDGPVRAKTSLEEVKRSRPEVREDQRKQSIPLEYKDFLR